MWMCERINMKIAAIQGYTGKEYKKKFWEERRYSKK